MPDPGSEFDTVDFSQTVFSLSTWPPMPFKEGDGGCWSMDGVRYELFSEATALWLESQNLITTDRLLPMLRIIGESNLFRVLGPALGRM